MRSSKIFLLALIFVLSPKLKAQTNLLTTDFEAGIPATYSVVDNDGFTPANQVAEYTSAWISVIDPENASNSVAASTSFFEPIGTASRWLVSPLVSLGAFGNFISWDAKSQDASFPDDYLVLVSTTDNVLSSFTDTIGSVQEENSEWTTRTVDLSSKGYNGQSIYFAFVNVTDNGFKLYLDNIDVWKEDPAGLNDLSANLSVVYPNPFKDLINVKSPETTRSILVRDISGKLLLSKENSTQLSTENLPSGIYLVQVLRSNGAIETHRLIKN